MDLDELIEVLQKIKRNRDNQTDSEEYRKGGWSIGSGTVYMFDGYEHTGVTNVREDSDGDILLEIL